MNSEYPITFGVLSSYNLYVNSINSEDVLVQQDMTFCALTGLKDLRYSITFQTLTNKEYDSAE